LLVGATVDFSGAGLGVEFSPTETPVEVFGVLTKIEHEEKIIVTTNVIDINIFFIIFIF